MPGMKKPTAKQAAKPMGYAKGGMVKTKGYAAGGMVKSKGAASGGAMKKTKAK